MAVWEWAHWGQGELKEVQRFSTPSPTESAPPLGGAPPAPRMALMSQMPMSSNVMRRDSISMVQASNPLYDNDAPKIAAKPSNNRATHHAGVVCNFNPGVPMRGSRSQVPVKVEMVESGSQFKFERLLVLNQPLTLSVEVRRSSRGMMPLLSSSQFLKLEKKGKRTLRGGCCSK